MRVEVSRAGLGTTIIGTTIRRRSLTPQLWREIVTGEVCAGVAAAGRDRWSTKRLSTMIENFLNTQYPADNGKSKVGSKHRRDVESRLAAFLLFTGDQPVRDVTRDDIKAYRDICLFVAAQSST